MTEEVDDDAGGVDADETAPVPATLFVAPTLVVPVFVCPVAEPVPADEASVDVEDELDGSALANPGEVATMTPIPKAAANAPTRPM